MAELEFRCVSQLATMISARDASASEKWRFLWKMQLSWEVKVEKPSHWDIYERRRRQKDGLHLHFAFTFCICNCTCICFCFCICLCICICIAILMEGVEEVEEGHSHIPFAFTVALFSVSNLDWRCIVFYCIVLYWIGIVSYCTGLALYSVWNLDWRKNGEIVVSPRLRPVTYDSNRNVLIFKTKMNDSLHIETIAFTQCQRSTRPWPLWGSLLLIICFTTGANIAKSQKHWSISTSLLPD